MHIRKTGERHGAVRGPRTPADGGQRYVHTVSETAHRRHGAACELRHIKKTDPATGASLPYPPHERCVEVEVDLGAGAHACTVHGSDLTYEYVSINADYRS